MRMQNIGSLRQFDLAGKPVMIDCGVLALVEKKNPPY